MKFSQLKKDLENRVGGVYLVEGEDAFFRRSAVELISARCITALPELNFMKLSGVKAQELCENCMSLPMMSERRCIVAEEYYPKAAELAVLKKYNLADMAHATLVVVNSAESDIQKAVPGAISVDCGRVDEGTAAQFAAALIKRSGASIGGEAARLLAVYCGRDMARIASEIGKLSHLGHEVTADDIRELVTEDTDLKAYKFGDAVLKKDGAAYQYIAEFDDAPSKLLSGLSSLVRRMAFVKGAAASDNELAAKLYANPYAVTAARRLAAGFSAERIRAAVNACTDAETSFKLGRCSAETALYSVTARLFEL